MQEYIYMDRAATVPIKKEVITEMEPYYSKYFANPSSVGNLANESIKCINKSRKLIAETINADKKEIIFTSGGTESDNWAIKSLLTSEKKHIIVSEIEHHAILNSCNYMKKMGYDVSLIPCDKDGVVDVDKIKREINSDTGMISVMLANNEIGTIQPISEIGRIARENSVLFHTDAVSAYGHVDIDVKKMNIDLLSVSAHKIGGPRGIGFLYVNNDIVIEPFIHGGKQERNLRAGTENTPAIAGFAEACQLAISNMHNNTIIEKSLQEHFINRVTTEINDSKLNGSKKQRLSGNVNFGFKNVNSEDLISLLCERNIYCSNGSACNSGNIEQSHVIRALGEESASYQGILRFTFDESNTMEEVDFIVDELKKIIKYLRKNH